MRGLLRPCYDNNELLAETKFTQKYQSKNRLAGSMIWRQYFKISMVDQVEKSHELGTKKIRSIQIRHGTAVVITLLLNSE